jgi:CHAT domain-containing protein
MRLSALVFIASLPWSQAWPQSPGIQRLIDESKKEMGQQHFDLSIQLARQAIEMSLAGSDRQGLAASWLRLSFDCFYARKLPDAIDAAKQAQKMAASIGDNGTLARAIGAEADALRDQGKLEDARELYEKQLVYIRAAGDRRAELIHQRMTALLYRRIGDKSRAIANGENALRLARELHDAEQEAACLFVLGAMEREQRMDAAAIEHLSAALKMPETTEQTRIQILQSIGTAYCDLKQYGRCTETMKQQLDLALASGVPNQIAWGHNKLAYAESLMGAHADAYANALEAVRVLRTVDHDPYDEAVFLSQAGEELVSLGRVREAVPYFEQGISLIEQLRQGLVPSEEALARAASAGETKELFDETVDAQFSIDPRQAFHTHELARARAFLSILSDSKIDLRQGMPEADRAREAALFRRIAAIRKQISQPDRASATAQQADAELDEAESALESFRLEMRKANPRLANIRYPRPLAVDEARELLKPGTTLVEYSLGDKRSFVWALSRERFASAELPAAKEIEGQVDAYRKLLTSRVSGLTVKQSEKDVESQAARLYGTLLKPVEAEIAGSRELVIVPDGTLHYLPFEALSFPGANRSGAYLLERFPISYAASATSFLGVDVQASPVRAGMQLLAFGDPSYGAGRGSASGGFDPGGFDPGPLPYTRAEIEGIAALFPPRARSIYLGAGASQKSVAGESVGQYRYIHFATHGLLDEAHPERSGLALTPGKDDDGVLRVDAITTLRLQADVVTLSACNTGLGGLFSGEGMLGLVRAFLYAGAGSVNVSLWNVNDAATAALMKEFYRNLSRSMPPDQALRSAKLAILGQEDALWRHPHFWAPFVLWLR